MGSQQVSLSALETLIPKARQCKQAPLRGIQQFDNLSPAERLRFSAFLAIFFKNFEGQYYFHKDGTLEPAHWAQVERTMTDVVSYPGTQTWWSVRRHWHTDEFAALLDRMIKEAPEAKAYDLYLKESRAAK